MRARTAGIVLLACVAVLTSTTGCKSGRGLGKGDRVPDFVLPRMDGSVQKLSNLRGNVVLVNLWATWCPPCIAEMPLLDQIAREYADRGLVVLGVAGDEDPGQVKRYMRAAPIAFPILLDPAGSVGTAYGITGYPETFVVDREGRLTEKFVGPLPFEGEAPARVVIDAIEAALGTG